MNGPLFPRERSRSRIDCFALLLDLENWGVTNTRAAFELGVPRTTLRHWKDGAEPGYSDGCRLIELHAYVGEKLRTGKLAELAPDQMAG